MLFDTDHILRPLPVRNSRTHKRWRITHPYLIGIDCRYRRKMTFPHTSIARDRPAPGTYLRACSMVSICMCFLRLPTDALSKGNYTWMMCMHG